MSEEIRSAEPLEKQKKSIPWFYCLLALVVIASLGGLTSPMVIRSQKKSPQTEATSNARQIGLALFEFETEYGTFPSEVTAAEVTKLHPGHGLNLSGDSSNTLFRQLIAAKITQSEMMFYAKATGVHKPDGDISPGHALERGEVAFGCVSGISTAGNPARIVAFGPLIPGTTKFDPKQYDGRAVLLRIDNSVTSVNIDEEGNAIVAGQNILSPDHPVWGNKETPKFHYPDFDLSEPSFFKKLFSK